MSEMRQTGNAGFTLVEVVVGLALFGLLMLALTGAVRIGLVGGARVEAATAALEERRTAAHLFGHLVRRIEPMPDWSGREASTALMGASATLEMVAVLPGGLGGGLGLVRLTRSQDRLIATTCPFDRARARCAGAAASSVLAEGVTRLSFAYFGTAAAGEDARWLDTWDGQPSLPRAIRMAVETRRGPWPVLIAHPAIEVTE
ncbi:MAG: prepilin-type N-terminal cleavage/methylation domain-containing protein [Alphaproteobacteria bacterium]|nr:prepilin-type N-terminal cleavage/methylation domain-containing protein [Alphaproteobacteria bacterium]